MILIEYLINEVRYRWQIVKAGKDAGYSTETVIAVAVLSALALAALAIIAGKIIAKANSINLDGGVKAT